MEALWSQFENVMAKDPDTEADEKTNEGDREDMKEGDTAPSEESG